VASIEVRPGDEVLVEFDLPPTGMWGNPQRNKAMARATGDYLAFIDDDDYYVTGHRQIMEDAINANPEKPILFKMQYPDGKRRWLGKSILAGNIGSPMILVPNEKKKLYKWFSGRNMADYIFVRNWGWKDEEVVWRDEVIALLGHNNEKLPI
jgi:glycosyltransferase involved in cell wall biosynthesis